MPYFPLSFTLMHYLHLTILLSVDAHFQLNGITFV